MKPTLIRTRGEYPPEAYPFQDPITGKGYRDTETGFDLRVSQIINDRAANRRLIKNDKYLSVDYVARELSEYVCCQLRGNPKYCVGGDPPATNSPGGFNPVIAGKVCPHCHEQGRMREVICVPCGNKRTGYFCENCGKQSS